VIEQITKCKRIVTSSLHAAVIADAFGIPRQLELPPQDPAALGVHHGGDFKYWDYQSVFTDTNPHFGEFWVAPRAEVETIQNNLHAALATAIGEHWTPPETVKPVRRPGFLGKLLPCNWPCRRPEISVLVPFRDDGEHRTQVWHWLKQYWEWNLPNSEIIMGSSAQTPFSKSEAVNNAALRARGRVFVVLDADAYMSASAIKRCADEIVKATKAGKRLWFVPYQRLYRLNRTATLAILGTDPVEPYFVPSPPPDGWLEQGLDPSGKASHSNGHQFGAMVLVMPRKAFFLVNGMDPRMRGWGSEDESFLRALDTLYCQHNLAPNDVCHLWHVRDGVIALMTRRWVGQRWTAVNSRLARRYQIATGEPGFMRALVDEHPLEW
jgi:hypothetical protein